MYKNVWLECASCLSPGRGGFVITVVDWFLELEAMVMLRLFQILFFQIHLYPLKRLQMLRRNRFSCEKAGLRKVWLLE